MAATAATMEDENEEDEALVADDTSDELNEGSSEAKVAVPSASTSEEASEVVELKKRPLTSLTAPATAPVTMLCTQGVLSSMCHSPNISSTDTNLCV